MNNYTCIVTKIRAMQKNILKDEDYDRLSKFKSMPELVEFLKNHPTYAPYFSNMNPAIVHRSEIEKRLYRAYNNEFTKIYKFADLNTRKYLKAFAFNFVVLFIKKSMHSLYMGNTSDIDQTPLHEFFKHYTKFDPAKLLESNNLTELIEALNGTEIYAQMKHIYDTTGDQLIFFETFLDSYMFKKLWNLKFNLLNQDDIRYIRKVYGTTIDLINISTIYRSKKYYNLHDSSIIPFLIPINYKLTKDDINSMLHAEDLKACIDAISHTKYSYIIPELEHRTIGSVISDVIKKVQKQSVHQCAYSFATIGAFFYARQQEILYLISVTEGIRYNIGSKEIKKFLTKY